MFGAFSMVLYYVRGKRSGMIEGIVADSRGNLLVGVKLSVVSLHFVKNMTRSKGRSEVNELKLNISSSGSRMTRIPESRSVNQLQAGLCAIF
jgi:hypothetical protein